MKVIVYCIEQLIKNPNDKDECWYEIGEDHKILEDALNRIKHLKKLKRKGFRAIKKTIEVEILKTI